MTQHGYLFGMDIGTTAIKCVICDPTNRKSIISTAVSIQRVEDELLSSGRLARITHLPPSNKQRSVEAVLVTIQNAIRQIPSAYLQKVKRVGICGQMHGIVWWKAANICSKVSQFLSSCSMVQEVSWTELITWEDQRCTPDFLTQIQVVGNLSPMKSSPLATGYGLATFAYILQHTPERLQGFDCCGTIQDFIAYVLCGKKASSETFMDITNAYSWGAFDSESHTWNRNTIQALGIPLEILPAIHPPGDIIGTVQCTAFNLPLDTPVCIPMGDHPCSVLAALYPPMDKRVNRTTTGALCSCTLINFGTSAQLAMVLTPQDLPLATSSHTNNYKSFEVRPFIGGQFLGVAAALSGGNMFACLVEKCRQWMEELDLLPHIPLDDGYFYEKLITLGLKKQETSLHFVPTFQGERFDPFMRGQMDHLDRKNWSLGDMSAAISKGLIENLFNMVPANLIPNIQQNRMIGTGNALLSNALLQTFLKKKLHHEGQLELQNTCDAAVGAALCGDDFGIFNPI